MTGCRVRPRDESSNNAANESNSVSVLFNPRIPFIARKPSGPFLGVLEIFLFLLDYRGVFSYGRFLADRGFALRLRWGGACRSEFPNETFDSATFQEQPYCNHSH